MSDSSRHKPQQTTEQVVVDDYLQSLLRDVEVLAAAAEEVLPTPVVEKTPLARVLEKPSPVKLVEPRRPVKPVAQVKPVIRVEPAEPIEPAEVPAVTMRPQWAQGRFQTLVFHVNGLKLAVALNGLAGIAKGQDDITPVPGQPAWYLGLKEYRGRQVGIVDTARLIMPERLTGVDRSERMDPTHILFIDEGQWGLSCDSIGRVLQLDAEAVNWRTSRGKRPWLAGTLIQEMCALIDVKELVSLVDKERKAPRQRKAPDPQQPNGGQNKVKR